MMWIVFGYLYLAGLFPVLHLASDAPGPMHIGKIVFVLLWPLICPATYAWAIWKAASE
jgi:hypothetical protein